MSIEFIGGDCFLMLMTSDMIKVFNRKFVIAAGVDPLRFYCKRGSFEGLETDVCVSDDLLNLRVTNVDCPALAYLQRNAEL